MKSGKMTSIIIFFETAFYHINFHNVGGNNLVLLQITVKDLNDFHFYIFVE